MADDGALDTSQSDRKVWLVKVPNFVAERWHAACQQAMAGKVGDDEQQDLGTLHLQPAAESGQLKPAALSTRPAANLPQKFKLEALPDVTASRVFSYEQAKEEDSAPSTSGAVGVRSGRLVGAVALRFDLVPAATVGSNGALQLDAAYRGLAKARTEKSAVRARIETIQDERHARALIAGVAGERAKRPAPTAVTQRPTETKRAKLERDELESLLFREFAAQPHWKFDQLQKRCGQPATYLKQVLNDIALLNQRGPYAQMWELKKQYKQ